MDIEHLLEMYKKFLASNIDSIGKLEVLLWMYAHPETEWDARAVSAELRSTESAVADQLAALAANKIISSRQHAGTVFYAYESSNPGLPGLNETMRDIAQMYKQYPTRLIEWIYAFPKTGIHEFADAFIIRKDK